MPSPNRLAAFDRSFFTILCRAHNGDIYSAERTLGATDRAAVVKDIADGQVEDVLAVLEFNPAEGWSKDASADIALDVLRYCLTEDGEIAGICLDFVEDQLGCGTVAEAMREVA